MDKLLVIQRTIRICAQIYHMASIKDDREMTAEEEIIMVTYVVSKSVSAFRLFSNYQ